MEREGVREVGVSCRGTVTKTWVSNRGQEPLRPLPSAPRVHHWRSQRWFGDGLAIVFYDCEARRCECMMHGEECCWPAAVWRIWRRVFASLKVRLEQKKEEGEGGRGEDTRIGAFNVGRVARSSRLVPSGASPGAPTWKFSLKFPKPLHKHAFTHWANPPLCSCHAMRPHSKVPTTETRHKPPLHHSTLSQWVAEEKSRK